MSNSNNGDDNLNDDDLQSISKSTKINSNDSSSSPSPSPSPSKTLIPPHLPEEIIFNEILPRLQVKSLIRFKSVSKQWYSFISSSKFVLRHLNFSSLSSNQIIVPASVTSALLLSYDEMNNLNNAVEMNYVFRESEFKPCNFIFLGVSNGLICLCHRYSSGNTFYMDHTFFSIINPALNKYCEIANPINSEDIIGVFASDRWFGYVPSIDDYKIIAKLSSVSNIGMEIKGFIWGVYVYSLTTGVWKLINELSSVLSRSENLSCDTTVVDNVLYWSPCPMHNQHNRPQSIIGLNVVTEEVKQLPWMDWLNAYLDTEFFVMNGCLSLYCSEGRQSPTSDVWTLKQLDDWSTWEKTFSVRHGGMQLWSVSSSNKFLVSKFHSGQGKPRSCELKIIDGSKDTEEQSQGDAYHIAEHRVGYGGGFYFESLVWPLSNSRVIESTEEEQKV